jgi:hypothetical protein
MKQLQILALGMVLLTLAPLHNALANTLAAIPFLEGLGTIAHDQSSYANNVKLENGPVWLKDATGYSLAFDGVNDIGRIPQNPALNLTQEFSFAVWVKTTENRINTTTRQREFLFRKGSTLMFGYELDDVENYLWLRFFIRYTDGSSQEVEYRDDLANSTRDGRWHHFVVNFKQATVFELYIDGVLTDRETPRSTAAVKLSTSNNDYILGGKESSSNTIERAFKGQVGGLVIGNKILSDAEVKSLFWQ